MMRWLKLCALMLLVLLLGALGVSSPLAQEEEQEVQQPQVKRIERQEGGWLEAAKRRISASYVQGVDNNVNLDSKRKSSGFSQENVDLAFTWPFLDTGSLILEDHVTNINYYDVTDANLVDNLLEATIEWPVEKIGRFRTGLFHDFTWRPRSESGTYNTMGGRWSLRQPLLGTHYHELGYELFARRYHSRKARNPWAQLSDDKRKDWRHVVEYVLGLKAAPQTVVKVKNRWYTNNSNEQFHDFYDYWSYQTSLSIIQGFTKQLLGLVGFSYEHRNFYSRRVTNTKNTEQKNDLWIPMAVLVYSYSPNLSFSYTYVYRENHSNDPPSDYSGTVNTFGIHYTF